MSTYPNDGRLSGEDSRWSWGGRPWRGQGDAGAAASDAGGDDGGDSRPEFGRRASDRRRYRRHAMASRRMPVEVIDADGSARPLGEIVNLSAGGLAVRTSDPGVAAWRDELPSGARLRVRLRLPTFAGISPFIDAAAGRFGPVRPATEWVGWLAVVRVSPAFEDADDSQDDADAQVEIAGRLLEMDEIDRGMLGLYLSTQPMAA